MLKCSGSYATVREVLEPGQVGALKGRGVEVHSDEVTGTLMLVAPHRHIRLDGDLEVLVGLSSVNDSLNEAHKRFVETVDDVAGSQIDYRDVLLTAKDTMRVNRDGSVRGFALARRSSGVYEILNDAALSELRPFILGYGRLLNPRELGITFDRHSSPIDFTYDRAFWVVASGKRTKFKKVPTRGYWAKDPAVIANSAALDIEDDPEGKLVGIVYDAEPSRKDAHSTFQRELDYRFEYIDNIVQVITNEKGGASYDPGRPILAVKAFKVKFGHGRYHDIQALSTAEPLLNYAEVIVRGLLVASEVGGEEGKSLLERWAVNTRMPDGKTLLASRPEWAEAIDEILKRAQKGLDSLLENGK